MAPIHYAVYGGHDAVLPLLMATGADPNLTDQHGFTPMHIAIAKGYHKCA